MKKMLASICIALVLCAFSFFDHTIIGHWVSNDGAPGSKILVDFNEDSTFKVTVNNEVENEGRYKFYNDTFCMYDNKCGMQTAGIYKVNFFTADSLSFRLISDSCTNRISEMNGGVISRLR